MYRMIGAALIALAAALLIGPRLIRFLKKLHFGQTIYELGPSHQQKQGTPVMGGLMMAAGILRGGTAFGTMCFRCWPFRSSAWASGLPTIISKRLRSAMTD